MTLISIDIVIPWWFQAPNFPTSHAFSNDILQKKHRATGTLSMFHWNKHEQHMLPFPECLYGYGSIPIDTFLGGWTSIYQLFGGSLGARVLTHSHMSGLPWRPLTFLVQVQHGSRCISAGRHASAKCFTGRGVLSHFTHTHRTACSLQEQEQRSQRLHFNASLHRRFFNHL